MYALGVAAKSEKGPYRRCNEDNYRLETGPSGSWHLCVVADGMGGQQAGECASRIAVEQIADHVRRHLHGVRGDEAIARVLQEAAVRANNEILSLAAVEPSYAGMGTTVVFVLVKGDRAYAGGIGDSRCYHLRNNILEQLTEDHTLASVLERIGSVEIDQMHQVRFRNTLYKYLGSKEAGVGPDIKVLAPRAGDRMLLTTDGLTGVVSDERIASILGAAASPQEAVDQLVNAALRADSRDNITCVAIFFDPTRSD